MRKLYWVRVEEFFPSQNLQCYKDHQSWKLHYRWQLMFDKYKLSFSDNSVEFYMITLTDIVLSEHFVSIDLSAWIQNNEMTSAVLTRFLRWIIQTFCDERLVHELNIEISSLSFQQRTLLEIKMSFLKNHSCNSEFV